MLEPSIFWSLAQAIITAPSFTQNTSTSSIPAALRASWPLRYPGTWHVDHVGVNAPGRPTTRVFLPFRRSGMFTFSGGKPKSSDTLGNALGTLTDMLKVADGLQERPLYAYYAPRAVPLSSTVSLVILFLWCLILIPDT